MPNYTILHRPEEMEDMQGTVWKVTGGVAENHEDAAAKFLTKTQIKHHDFQVIEDGQVLTKSDFTHDGIIDEITEE